MSDYRTYVTQTGFGLERDAKFNNTHVDLAVLVIGDGVLADSSSPAERTDLLHQVREYGLTIEKDEKDPNVWIARAEIPAGDGGFFIKEAGVKTKDGYLYAYARQAGDYKPLLSEGQGKSYTIRLKFIPGNADTIQIKIDPSVQFATPTDLSNAVKAHIDADDPHPQYKTYAVNRDNLHTDSSDPHPQYQAKNRLFSVSGDENDIVLTSKAGMKETTELNNFDEFSFIVSETNTDFVTIKIDGLAPLPLNGVLSDTQIFKTALLTVRYIAGSLYIANQINPKTGNPVALIGEIISSPFAGIGSCKMRFDSGELSRATHPILFAKAQKTGLVDQALKDADLQTYGGKWGDGDGITTFTMPIYDGTFLRYADNGRGLDVGRELGSWQGDAIRNIVGDFGNVSYQIGLGGGNGTGAFIGKTGLSGEATSPVTQQSENILDGIRFDASRVVPTASDNRPMNYSVYAEFLV
jgi:phage-related tail fiber protein